MPARSDVFAHCTVVPLSFFARRHTHIAEDVREITHRSLALVTARQTSSREDFALGCARPTL